MTKQRVVAHVALGCSGLAVLICGILLAPSLLERWYLKQLEDRTNPMGRVQAIQGLQNVGGNAGLRALLRLLESAELEAILKKQFKDPVEAAACDAALAIVRRKSGLVMPTIVEYVCSTDRPRRRLALYLIEEGNLVGASIADGLVTAMGISKDDMHSCFAILGSMYGRGEREELIGRSLTSDSAMLRLGAVRAVVLVGKEELENEEHVCNGLYNCMEYREKHIRREAFVAMLSVCGCGENELLKASELLDDESATVLADALYALSLCEQLPLWLGERAEALLSHEAPEVRTGALSILGKRPGENVDERVEQILGSLNDNDPQVRAEAVEALKYVRPVSRRVVESLGVACCRDVDAAVRAFSVKALGKMGREARAAQEYVLEALHDPDSVVRQHAARTLALIDADAEKAVVALEALVERENEGSPEYMMGVRMAARESLEKIRGESQ